MGGLHKAGIEINRKVLADLAMNHPEAFKAVVEMCIRDRSRIVAIDYGRKRTGIAVSDTMQLIANGAQKYKKRRFL